MEKTHLRLKFKNHQSAPLELYLEPIPDRYVLAADQQVEVHAICRPSAREMAIEIHWFESGPVLYPPGLGDDCEDFYLTSDGVRLAPAAE